jgi:predicted small integral membrane protein
VGGRTGPLGAGRRIPSIRFPDNPLIWRALTSPQLHRIAFWSIVVVELAVAAFCLWGGAVLLGAVRATAAHFNAVKAPAVAGLTLGILLWFAGFMAVGGEWFLMWQSEQWNGIEAAFRFTVSLLLTLLFVAAEDRD